MLSGHWFKETAARDSKAPLTVVTKVTKLLNWDLPSFFPPSLVWFGLVGGWWRISALIQKGFCFDSLVSSVSLSLFSGQLFSLV